MSSELASRAQHILREQRDLYDYWRTCAQARPLPSRYDIDPVDIPHLLPGLSLLDVGQDLDALRYRLAGTRVREIYGTEITGRAVFDTGLQHKRDYWRSVYRKVIEEGIPMQGVVRGSAAGREHLFLIWLRLPLSGLSGRVERVLGYDAALPCLGFSAPVPAALPGAEDADLNKKRRVRS
ncbi:MAG: PAS domain-containing protein [Rhodomicrobium sp.]|nr:PAS domain-containing protein [Rhodomicrobium sp.]